MDRETRKALNANQRRIGSNPDVTYTIPAENITVQWVPGKGFYLIVFYKNRKMYAKLSETP